jgi:flagellin-like protein
MKGISPLVATVLIIAVTVGAVGIVSVWVTGFFRESSETVGSQSKTQIDCSAGAIGLTSLRFASNYLSGNFENKGLIVLGNISMNIIFQNASSEKFDFCTSGSNTVRCTTGNLSLLLSDEKSFNVTIGGSNYDTIRIFTNCTGVSDTARRGDVTT